MVSELRGRRRGTAKLGRGSDSLLMPMNVRRWLLLGILVAAVAALAAWGYRWWTFPLWVEQQAGSIEAAYQQGEYERVIALTEELLRRQADRPDSVMLGARAALRLKRAELALQLLERGRPRLPEAGSVSVLQAKRLSGYGRLRAEVALQLKRLGTAERAYREAVQWNARDMDSRERLAMLLIMLGRFREARPLLLDLLRDGHIREPILTVLGTGNPVFHAEEVLQASLRNEPEYVWPHLGLARVAIAERRFEAARRHLQAVIRVYPRQTESLALLGEVAIEHPPQDLGEQLKKWSERLEPDADQDAGIWKVRGLWALRQGDYPAAARAFAEAVRRDPCDVATISRLAGSLSATGDADAARAVAQYARRLEALDTACHLMRESGASYHTVARVALLCEQLGRYWEAYAWGQLFRRRPAPTPADPARGGPPADYLEAGQTIAGVLRRVDGKLSPDLPRVATTSLPTRTIDLAKYPVPSFDTEARSEETIRRADLTRRPRFADVTRQVGIDFRFHNADDPSTPGMRLIETTGGGVAVIDFDRDGWPDLYFPDGGPWPGEGEPSPHTDRLYRNTGNGRFVDVTRQAGLGDRAFSQGAAVGDLDNDGWPDLLVCNLGRNRLYLNNGDGTFREITAEAGLETEHWSTSAAIADINLDGISDIFVVNYLAGERAYHRICGTPDQPRVCSPSDFEAAPDQLFLGSGDGRWPNATSDTGVTGPRGNGLGCVVADLTGERQMAVFVANDATANFCYVNQSPPGRRPQFDERAILWGLAFSQDGRSQGCMGVAAGDFDDDGRLDLLVSNFYRESNALYRQQPGPVFVDESARRGIAEASERMLGFGTQFLDAELDGLVDLVVVNGHIDDLTRNGVPYRMPAQYLRNLGGSFSPWPAAEAGDYFERKVLGRGLARIDWNLDGKPEFAVSHIGDAAVLVENRSENTGHFLAVELSGTVSARDAIGAVVVVRIGEQRFYRHLTAGDGYMASNHRRLIFGLGSALMVDQLEVRWPSGQRLVAKNLPVDQAVHCIEGQGLYTLPR